MKNFFKGTLVTCLVTIGGGLAFADSVSESSFNAGLTAGTLGVGINLSTPISDSLSARVNVNGLQYSHTLDVDNIRYDGDIDFKNAGFLVDYFPFESTFRVSGGVYYNGNAFDGSATPFGSEKITIGNNIYTASEVGKLNTHVEFDNVAPYLGIGWGNNSNEKGWGYSFDLGVDGKTIIAAMVKGSELLTDDKGIFRFAVNDDNSITVTGEITSDELVIDGPAY